jgi:parallel beta-helix repeat protein
MRRRTLPFVVRVFAVITLWPSTATATDYYVSPKGADANAGTSATAPWQTIARVNGQQFAAGDRVLFEGGQTFTGSLYFDAADAGSATQPVTVTSYGTGRATINAGAGNGVLVYNAGGFRITGLRFVGAGRAVNTGAGVFVYTDLSGDVKLDTLAIESVDATGFGEAGVLIGAANGRTGYRHLRLNQVVAADNAKQGIFIYAAQPNTHQDVYVGYSRAFNNSGIAGLTHNTGNGIVVSGVDGGKIERSVAHDNGWLCDASEGPVGIWTYASRNVVIQFNESYNNKTGGSADGGGFDLDADTSASILQYNYSHGNAGAGYLLAQASESLSHTSNTVRYNISENDARRNDYAGIHVWGRVRNAEIYNNTVYVASTPTGTPGLPRGILITNTGIPSRDLASVHLRNNIVVTGSVRAVEVTAGQIDGMTDLRFENNIYYASGGTAKFTWGATTYSGLAAWRVASGQETRNGANVGSEANPMLRNAGAGVTLDDATLLVRLEGYRLSSGSPAIDSGIAMSAFGISPGSRDYYGEPLPQYAAFDIGAHEFGVDCTWSISPAGATLPATGGTVPVQVTTTATCGWTARPKTSWLSVSGASTGRGNGVVTIAAGANPLGTRSGTVAIGLNTFTIQQLGATNAPPTVAITSPGNGATYPAGSSVTLAASASDADGTVARVDFLANGATLGSDTTAPYSLTWTPAAGASYTLIAKATDDRGAVATSAAVTIAVGASGALPSPWQTTDIGAVGRAGSVSYDGSAFKVIGSGADIWGTTDALRFVYQPLTGDGSVVARVASVQAVDVWTKAGVMIRESLAATARHASKFVSPGRGLAFQRRTSTGGTSTHTGTSGTAPVWVRIARAGSTFTAAWSSDGVTWQTLGSDTIGMNATVYVGLAVTSHNNTASALATFDHVAVK